MTEANNNKILLIVSTFNTTVSDKLVEGCSLCYEKHGFNKKSLDIIYVPGAFEIPGTVNQILKQKLTYDAIITLGSIIKGETAHFEYIASSVTSSISSLSMKSTIPIIFGILTTYNLEQALNRADSDGLNKGGEVMEAAILSIQNYQQINNK